MKKLIYLLICLFLQPSNLCAQSKAPSSFEDFLKQMKSEQTESEMPSEEIVSKEIEEPEQEPFSPDISKQIESEKAEKIEREIVDTLEHQITPLANDLFKIVESPEAKKTLEEKKKLNEQKQKAAEKRLEELKRQRGSGYHPSSYRPGGKEWSPSSYSRGGRGDGYASSYSPSDWDRKNKGKNWWDTDDKDKDKDKGLKNKGTTGKETEEDNDKKSGQTIDKDVKKALTEAENLTDQICSIISNNMSASPETLATNRETFEYLGKLFEDRQKALRYIPSGETTTWQELESNKAGRRIAGRRGATRGRGITPAKSKVPAKTNLGPELTKKLETEKGLWHKFLPKIVHARTFTQLIDDTDEMKKAQSAAQELLEKLKNGKISEKDIRNITNNIEKDLLKGLGPLDKVDENDPNVKRIYRVAEKIPGGPLDATLKKGAHKAKEEDKAKEKEEAKEKKEVDPSLRKINKYTKEIKRIISQETSGLKANPTNQKEIENNQKIYKKIIAYELFTQILQLIDLREKELMEKDNPEEILKADADWNKFIPTLLQAITDTDPDLAKDKEKLDEQKQGKRLLSKLRSLGYVTEEQINEAQEKFENDLAAKIEAAKPGGQAEDEDELKRLQAQAKKLPQINTEKLVGIIDDLKKQAAAKTTTEEKAKKPGEDYAYLKSIAGDED